MIISASRRTDIPAFYSDWFFERIREGFVCVRNPMNYHQVSRIDLSPDVVDAIVFWTKDPSPMLDRLDLLKNYKYCFQFTLTSYGTDVEENVPNKGLLMIPTFKRLSEKLSPGHVIWRYDPILLSKKYTVGYHLDYFGKLAAKLSGFTEKCVVSFLDIYKNTRSNLESIGLRGFSDEDIEALSKGISCIAREYGLKVESCAEKYDLEEFGIEHGHCIGSALLESITGQKLDLTKDKNQRAECGCVSSIDIGIYNTCMHGCKYCYANYNPKQIGANNSLYDPSSPLLCGRLTPDDRVTERKMKSIIMQKGLFD